MACRKDWVSEAEGMGTGTRGRGGGGGGAGRTGGGGGGRRPGCYFGRDALPPFLGGGGWLAAGSGGHGGIRPWTGGSRVNSTRRLSAQFASEALVASGRLRPKPAEHNRSTAMPLSSRKVITLAARRRDRSKL